MRLHTPSCGRVQVSMNFVAVLILKRKGFATMPAAEILVPKAALRKQLRKHKGTFRSSNVKALAEVFDVSLTCMMCRIVEVHEDVIGFMVHDVVEQNSRLRLVCTRAIPSRWERIELHNASDSKIMMAFVNQKSVYGIQEFDMSTSATGVRWVCSEPIRKSERKQCHTIVTLIYQRPQPQPQRSPHRSFPWAEFAACRRSCGLPTSFIVFRVMVQDGNQSMKV